MTRVPVQESVVEENFYNIINDIQKFDDYELAAFYRGGLPLGVRVSNNYNKPLNIIMLQTRDKFDVDENFNDIFLFTPKSKKLIIVEDIIDTGKTIKKFMDVSEHLFNEIIVYAVIGDDKICTQLETKYPKLKIKYVEKMKKHTWYVFPWEQPLLPHRIHKGVSNPLVAGVLDTFEKCSDILVRKNSDYNVSDNPFDNFFNVEKLNITTAEKGILVRLSDKVSRIISLLEKEAKVKDESIYDTIDDAINYFAILKEVIKYKKSKNS